RFYAVPMDRHDIDWPAIEAAPPLEVLVAFSEVGLAAAIERARAERNAVRAGTNVVVARAGSVPEGESRPALVKRVGHTDIVSYRGRYYGIPAAQGAVDLTEDAVSATDGILSAITLKELEAELAYTYRWANSRGRLDVQEMQRKKGNPIRSAAVWGTGEMS